MPESDSSQYRRGLIDKTAYEGLLLLATCLESNEQRVRDGLIEIKAKDLKTLKTKYPAIYGEVQVVARKLDFTLPTLVAKKAPRTPGPRS